MTDCRERTAGGPGPRAPNDGPAHAGPAGDDAVGDAEIVDEDNDRK